MEKMMTQETIKTDDVTERLRLSERDAQIAAAAREMREKAAEYMECLSVGHAENIRALPLPDSAALDRLIVALERCLNFVENTESELGETLQCGDLARAALFKGRCK